MRATLLLCAALLMTGCAVNLTKGGSTTPLSIPAESRSNLVVNFVGNSKVLANADWGRIKTTWRNALQSEASTVGYSLTEQAGAARAAPQPGTILLVEVSNFRYMTPAMRYNFGIMAGNAWVNAKVTYLDLQTGETLGSRTYDTSSSAWEGVFSAMTDEQLQAVSKEMVAEVRSARVIALRANPAKATASEQGAMTREQRKQQQVEQLQRESLSYEEYMKRYKAIMAE